VAGEPCGFDATGGGGVTGEEGSGREWRERGWGGDAGVAPAVGEAFDDVGLVEVPCTDGEVGEGGSPDGGIGFEEFAAEGFGCLGDEDGAVGGDAGELMIFAGGPFERAGAVADGVLGGGAAGGWAVEGEDESEAGDVLRGRVGESEDAV